MSKRREGRETAIQLLFSHDFTHPGETHDTDAFFTLHSANPRTRANALALYHGVLAHLPDIDTRLTATLENFTLARLNGVDRNILRLAIYEMFHRTDVPPIVIINEAIEISKNFGTPDSSRFINGILDRLKQTLTRDPRQVEPTPQN